MSALNQKEYLKKYLSTDLTDERRKKKKKSKSKLKAIVNRVAIIDDDEDALQTFNEAAKEDLVQEDEDAPQVVAVYDERPIELRANQFDTNTWITIKSEPEDEDGDDEEHVNANDAKQANEDFSPARRQQPDLSPSRKNSTRNDDCSPPRRNSSRNKRENDDCSPPRRDPQKNKRENDDCSPPRRNTGKSKRNSNDSSPPRKDYAKSKRENDDYSPPRRNKRINDDHSPPRRRSASRNKRIIDSERKDASKNKRANEDGFSPPITTRKIKIENDLSPARRQTRSSSSDSDSVIATPRRIDEENDSDSCKDNPARNDESCRKEQQSPLRGGSSTGKCFVAKDLSPGRRNRANSALRRSKDASTSRRFRNFSPPRRSDEFRKQRDSRPSWKRRDFRRSNERSPLHRSNESRRRHDDQSPSRKSLENRGNSERANLRTSRNRSSESRKRTPERQKRSRTPLRKQKRNESPTTSSKMSKTLDGKTAGLQNAKDLVEETRAFKQREDELFRTLSNDVSGANAQTVLRDRKTGRIRDLEKEAAAKMEKEQAQAAIKEKYDRWGKGLKQVDDRNAKHAEDLHEMSKPLARYADDEDLERHLKEQEREGDPMLAYFRKKKKQEIIESGKPLKPQYEGEFMPNRFGIRPGHKWDGVDRSIGYEKRWFDVQNEKLANKEESYKWSTEDM